MNQKYIFQVEVSKASSCLDEGGVGVFNSDHLELGRPSRLTMIGVGISGPILLHLKFVYIDGHPANRSLGALST